MKIKELLVESFKSPFFNLLAIANLSLMAVLVSTGGFNPGSSTSFVYELNGPAIVVSVLLTGSMKSFSVVPPLIYLQWISIGTVSRFIANTIRMPEVE
ncbi:MAG: hypothetical protein AB7F88_06230 [Pyrinomonadaceae bacterium]